MTKILAIAIVAFTLFGSSGCGTIFNKRVVQAQTGPGVTVDGQTGFVALDQSVPHTVQYPNGGTCIMSSGISAGYLLLDIFLTGLVGIVVDAVTGDWTVLKGGCPGVVVTE